MLIFTIVLYALSVIGFTVTAFMDGSVSHLVTWGVVVLVNQNTLLHGLRERSNV